MKNLKISQKLLVGFGTVIALMLIIIWLTVSTLSSLDKIVDYLYNEAVQRVMISADVNSKTQEMAKNMLHAIGKAEDNDYVKSYFRLNRSLSTHGANPVSSTSLYAKITLFILLSFSSILVNKFLYLLSCQILPGLHIPHPGIFTLCFQ